jgi:hypothetical protein
MKPVKAWAAYRDGKFHDVFNPRIYRTQRGAKFYAGDDDVKRVRIVPESEYRRMMAAVKVAEQACETGQNMMSHELWHLACKYYETRQKAKGKVNRGK